MNRWTLFRNLSAAGALTMFVFGFVSAQSKVDLTALPVGTEISSEPQVGAIWSCQTTFNANAGASGDSPWFNGDGTFDYTAKAIVDGDVDWDGEIEITLDGADRVFTGNGLPVYHTTGNYPIATDDDAYQYDRNPNGIQEQTLTLTLNANPTLAETPSCVSIGVIGVMLSGSVFFNALDGAGHDAVAYETLDHCQGHPQISGQYHYHNLSDCVEAYEEVESGHSALMGYALDGFGIYGHHGEDGETLTSTDLDACHGHTHEIEWDGQLVEMYHYHATYEYPYTVGCYRGTPLVLETDMPVGQRGPGGPGGARPPRP
jgi:hypothetical protein